MNSETKQKLGEIETFWKENRNLEEIISKELKEMGRDYLDCLSSGRLTHEFGDTKTNKVVYLRVGFLSGKLLRSRDEKILCAVGFDGCNYLGEGKYSYKRIIAPFKKLPIFVQAAIFQTAFGGFEYPKNYNSIYENFLETCADFNKLEPSFKEFYLLDTFVGRGKVILRTFNFSEWGSDGRYKFVSEHIDDDEDNKPKTAILSESDMYDIVHNGICHWGFDYTLSTNKEELIGCLTDDAKKILEDYSVKSDSETKKSQKVISKI